ncbi:MAG: M50 family metallopeptidase [Armatimonadetes bacterium]|nr:M50 family metallopeptidase [Armatimonadota bacterium]
MPRRPLRPHQRLLLLASAAAVAAWVIPYIRYLSLPLIYLNTHIHELFHAIAAEGTGGDAARILVHADGSGLTATAGGNLFLIASAGYVGSAILGAAMIALGRTERSARAVLLVLAGVLTVGMVFWVRGDGIGVLSGVMWILLLAVLGRFLRGTGAIFAAQFLGVQQCLASAQAFLVLFQVSAFTTHQNDAKLLAEHTGMPAVLWATLWAVFSATLILLALRRAWRGGAPDRGPA